jgi:hypothetical protein
MIYSSKISVLGPGWPDEFVKKSPKMSPNPFFVKINLGFKVGSPKMWATFVIYKKCPKKKNHPMCENSPNLVTLSGSLTLSSPSRLGRRRQQFCSHLAPECTYVRAGGVSFVGGGVGNWWSMSWSQFSAIFRENSTTKMAYSATKMAFFFETNVIWSKIFKTSSILNKKCKLFRQKYFKNHNNGLWCDHS